MKILVPTDFSKYARYALDTAILIVKKLDGEIHLYHSADIPDDWEDLPAKEKYHDYVNKPIALRAKAKLEEWKAIVTAADIECQYHYTGGKYINNIEEITSKIDFDLIIAGSHGAASKEEWFLGTNTQKIVRKLHQNIMIVKNNVEAIDFKEVLYVSGLDVKEQEAFRRFLDFLSNFKVDKLYIMSVDTYGYFSQPSIVMKEALKDFKKIAEGYDVETYFYKDYSVESGVRHFVEEFNIDFVAISNHVRHPLKRIFGGSKVEMIVNHSDVPVMTIDY